MFLLRNVLHVKAEREIGNRRCVLLNIMFGVSEQFQLKRDKKRWRFRGDQDIQQRPQCRFE